MQNLLKLNFYLTQPHQIILSYFLPFIPSPSNLLEREAYSPKTIIDKHIKTYVFDTGSLNHHGKSNGE